MFRQVPQEASHFEHFPLSSKVEIGQDDTQEVPNKTVPTIQVTHYDADVQERQGEEQL